MENLINKTNFGLIYSDLEDLKGKLWKLIEEPRREYNNIKSFKDFSKVLVKDLGDLNQYL